MTTLQESAYWLCLLNHSGLKLSRLKPIVQRWHLMEGRPLVDLFNMSALELRTRFEVSDDEAESLLRATKEHATCLEKLQQWQAQNIIFLPLSHPHYPSRLIYNLPPQLQPLAIWAKGETSTLTEPSITILGQPEPDPETVEFVSLLAQVLIADNIGVVSGYGKGLDRVAFETILEHEAGRAVAVLPMGLAAFSQLTSKLDAPVAAHQAVLLSPFPPETPFKETLAEARNLLVDSLALALLVPDVDEDTQNRAEAALQRGMPVLVGMTDSPENRALISQGAFLMTDPGEVVDMVQQAIIDDAMQAQIAQTPAAETAPQSQPKQLLNNEEDFALRSEAVDPIDPDEALDILNSMGSVPSSLRDRLMAMEQLNQSSTDDSDPDPSED